MLPEDSTVIRGLHWPSQGSPLYHKVVGISMRRVDRYGAEQNKDDSEQNARMMRMFAKGSISETFSGGRPWNVSPVSYPQLLRGLVCSFAGERSEAGVLTCVSHPASHIDGYTFLNSHRWNNTQRI